MYGGSNIQINLGKNLVRLLQGNTTYSINSISTIIAKQFNGSNDGNPIKSHKKNKLVLNSEDFNSFIGLLQNFYCTYISYYRMCEAVTVFIKFDNRTELAALPVSGIECS